MTLPAALVRTDPLRYALVGVVAVGVVVATLVLPTTVMLAGVAFVVLGAIIVRARGDAVLVLLLVLASMAAVPASQTVSALGSVGTPALLLGLFAGMVWVVQWLAPRNLVLRRYRPVPVLVVVFVAANLASFAAAGMRAKDHVEVSAADRGLLMVLAGAGVALLASECVMTRDRLDTLVKGIVVAGCAIAAVGVVQFVTGFDPASRIAVPGLSATVDGAAFVGERSMFRRIAGTTLHPIEFSVVLCVVLPFAIHLALHASRRWFWAVALLGLALPMSVSRTAVVGMVALALVLVPSWPRSMRHRAYLGAIAYLVALRLLVPGLLGTIKSLFVDAGADPSIASRQTDYTFVNGFIAERPVFGRGFATFIPTRYDFLDNQYLMSLVETGVAGVTAFVLLVGGSAVVAALVRSRSSDPADRSLATAIVAALVVLGATAAAFDLLSFPTVRMLLFVVVGCAGALWRLTLPVVTAPATISSVEADRPPPVRHLHGASIGDVRSERSSP